MNVPTLTPVEVTALACYATGMIAAIPTVWWFRRYLTHLGPYEQTTPRHRAVYIEETARQVIRCGTCGHVTRRAGEVAHREHDAASWGPPTDVARHR